MCKWNQNVYPHTVLIISFTFSKLASYTLIFEQKFVSSPGLQKFDGEDLNNKARTKYQQEQLREWSEKQKQERDQADANQVRIVTAVT